MNPWKVSTLALVLAVPFGLYPRFTQSASAEESRTARLESALNHLRAAKGDLETSERRHRHHKPALVATDFAIKAVQGELDWLNRGDGKPTEPGGGKPVDPGGGKPVDPGGGGKPVDPGGKPTEPAGGHKHRHH